MTAPEIQTPGWPPRYEPSTGRDHLAGILGWWLATSVATRGQVELEALDLLTDEDLADESILRQLVAIARSGEDLDKADARALLVITGMPSPWAFSMGLTGAVLSARDEIRHDRRVLMADDLARTSSAARRRWLLTAIAALEDSEVAA